MLASSASVLPGGSQYKHTLQHDKVASIQHCVTVRILAAKEALRRLSAPGDQASEAGHIS